MVEDALRKRRRGSTYKTFIGALGNQTAFPWQGMCGAMEIRNHKKEDLSGSLLILGFPSRGLVGGVAANYVIEDLKMWHVASLYDPRMPPSVVVRQGVADSPIQFFVSAERCGPDGSCDKLVAGLSEVPIEPRVLNDVAWTIVRWAKQEKIRHIVVLEGVDAIAKVQSAAKSPKPGAILGARSISSKVSLKKFGVESVEESLLSSVASPFLLAANAEGVDLVALFVQAEERIPDAHAAAKLLRSVDDMLPHIDFRTEVLEKRAVAIEASMRANGAKQAKQLAAMRRAVEIMYQ